MVYRYAHSENESLEGYMNYSLSVFNVADFQKKSIPSEIPPELGNVTQCRYSVIFSFVNIISLTNS